MFSEVKTDQMLEEHSQWHIISDSMKDYLIKIITGWWKIFLKNYLKCIAELTQKEQTWGGKI